MTCAYAVRVALKKFPGVESVDVSLNKGLATVKLKPGNTVRPQEFWEAVRRNGFTPKETRALVRGEVTNSASLQLKVTGSNQLLDLKADSTLLEEARRQIGKIVTVEGALTPGKDLKAQIPLDVRSIRSDK
jgi:copper chaperone CopZ